MIDAEAAEGAANAPDETPEEGVLRRLQGLIDECEPLQTHYDQLRAEAKVESIEFMDGGKST